MFKYKVDILSALKEAGYTTYILEKRDHLFPGATLQKFRTGNTKITLETLGVLCELLSCQPGDLVEWVSDQRGKDV